MKNLPTFIFLFSISLIQTLMMLINEINAVLEESKLERFLLHFTSKKNGFMTVYALSMLNQDQRENICNSFAIFQKMVSNRSILLTSIDPAVETQSVEGISSIAAFYCITLNYEDFFYVTYSKDDEYFYLEGTAENNFSNLLVEVFTSQKIPIYHDIFENMGSKLSAYFNSEDYTRTANYKLSRLIAISEWPNLCQKFVPNYEDILKPAENKIDHISSTIHEESSKFDVPVLPCPQDKGNENIFYVAYYTDNIFFRIDVDSTSAENYATYDAAYYYLE